MILQNQLYDFTKSIVWFYKINYCVMYNIIQGLLYDVIFYNLSAVNICDIMNVFT